MKILHAVVCAALPIGAASLAAQAPAPLAALARMPVKEVTVFKDGHAFVLHEGALPTDAAGNVVMDYLPSPVLGTFWPYSSNTDVKLAGVVAGQRRVLVEQTALSLAELLDAQRRRGSRSSPRKPSARAGSRFDTRPRSSASPSAAPTSSRRPGCQTRRRELPEKGSVILVRTSDGVKAADRREHPGRHVQDAAQEQAVARGVPQPAHAEARLGEPQAVAHRAGRPRCICRRACAGFPATGSRSTAAATAAIKLQATLRERAGGSRRT